MKTIFYSVVDRRNFGYLLSEDGLSRLTIQFYYENQLLTTPTANQIIALWSSDPSKSAQLPEALICQDGAQNDWAAWITTFAARIRPFSAYMRLLTDTEFQVLSKRSETPEIGRIAWPISGLILGEVLRCSNLQDKALETLSASAFTSTLSYVIFRAAAIYPDYREWSDLFKMWEHVREITHQPTRNIESSEISRVCGIVLNAMGIGGISKLMSQGDLDLSQVCSQIINSPQYVPANLPGSDLFLYDEDIMHGPREDRVRAFEEFLKRIGKSSTRISEAMPFVIGYFSSRIAPGAMRHSSILNQVAKQYPTALLWYGFFSGFPEIKPNMQNGGQRGIDLPLSARRVIRELLKPEHYLITPSCDIAYQELLALSRTGEISLHNIITTTPSAAKIELLPGVCTSVKVSQSQQISESQNRILREREIMNKLGKQIAILQETYDALLANEPPGMQDSLFPAKRKKK